MKISKLIKECQALASFILTDSEIIMEGIDTISLDISLNDGEWSVYVVYNQCGEPNPEYMVNNTHSPISGEGKTLLQALQKLKILLKEMI